MAAGNDIRRSGEDILPGTVVLEAGRRLTAAGVGVAASLGRAGVECGRRPLVSVIATGDELLEPGELGRAGAIYNSNGHAIPALARGAGALTTAAGTVGDDPDDTHRAIAEALGGSDVLVLCGGVSVGPHDHVRRTLAELGARERFWGIALRPGKPTWFGTREQQLVFGLPGNPVSAMVTFTLLVAPALRAMSGASQLRHEARGKTRERLREARRTRPRSPLHPADGRAWAARHARRPPGLARAHHDARRGSAGDHPVREGTRRGRRDGRARAAARPGGVPMRVVVRLFAVLRERAGRDRVELELAPGATVADALASLAELPELAGVLGRRARPAGGEPRLRLRAHPAARPGTSWR